MNWDDYPNFSKREFDCKHTGHNKMQPEFMRILQDIRNTYGKPIIITSGFRHFTHPAEIHKKRNGEHTYGVAADISIRGEDALELLTIALNYGIKRIGIKQKGSGRFIHIGIGDRELDFPKVIWSY